MDEEKKLGERAKPRTLKSVSIAGFNLLNDEKVERAWAAVEKGVDADKYPKFTDLLLLAEYDKLGGAIKNKEGRKIEMGSFYDFANKRPREDVKLEELDYEDEYVLIPKKKVKEPEDPRIVLQKKIESRVKTAKKENNDGELGEKDSSEEPDEVPDRGRVQRRVGRGRPANKGN